MTADQEFLRLCPKAFPGIENTSDKNTIFHDGLLVQLADGAKTSPAQIRLMEKMSLPEPATLPKLSAVAIECKRQEFLDRMDKERKSYNSFADETIKAANERLAATILTKGSWNASVPIHTLEGPVAAKPGTGGVEYEWLEPKLTTKEEVLMEALRKHPELEASITRGQTKSDREQPKFSISIKLKQVN